MANPSAVRPIPKRIGGLALRAIAAALIRLLDPDGAPRENTARPSGAGTESDSRTRRKPPGGEAWSSYWAFKAIESAHEGLPLSGEVECALPFVKPEQLADALERAAESSDGTGVDLAGSREVDRWVRELPSELRARVERAIVDRGARGLPATFLRLEAETLASSVDAAREPCFRVSLGKLEPRANVPPAALHAAPSITPWRTPWGSHISPGTLEPNHPIHQILGRAIAKHQALLAKMRAMGEARELAQVVQAARAVATRQPEEKPLEAPGPRAMLLDAPWSRYWSREIIDRAHSGAPLGERALVLSSILPEQLAEVLELTAESSDGTGVDAKGSVVVDAWVRDLPSALRGRVERTIRDRGARGLPATFLRLKADELAAAVATSASTSAQAPSSNEQPAASPGAPSAKTARRL